MGYVFAMSPCIRCGMPFSYNLLRVPSLVVDGQREPVCEDCFHILNAIRKERGMPVWPDPLPGAYEAADEMEMPW